jgi:hypothetical protein
LAVQVALLTAAGSTVLAWDETSTLYRTVQIQPAGMTRRRDVATSPHIAGEYEISSVPGGGALLLEVLVTGASWTASDTAKNAIITASQVRRWKLRTTTDGVVETWSCYAADYVSVIEPAFAWAHMRRLTLTIPVSSPVPA